MADEVLTAEVLDELGNLASACAGNDEWYVTCAGQDMLQRVTPEFVLALIAAARERDALAREHAELKLHVTRLESERVDLRAALADREARVAELEGRDR